MCPSPGDQELAGSICIGTQRDKDHTCQNNKGLAIWGLGMSEARWLLQQIERPRTCGVRLDGSLSYCWFGDSRLKNVSIEGLGIFFSSLKKAEGKKKTCFGNVAIFMLFVILCLFPVLFTWILG